MDDISNGVQHKQNISPQNLRANAEGKTGSYSPVVSRLLVYAHLHSCHNHNYGSFSKPKDNMPFTYRQLQELIIEQQKQQSSCDSSSRELVQTTSDLANRLRAFASDGIVVKHFVDFALPPKLREKAAEVTTSPTGEAEDHTEEEQKLGSAAKRRKLKEIYDVIPMSP